MADHIRALAVRWFNDVWNHRRAATIDELMAPDAVGYMEGGLVHGPEEFKAVRDTLLGAFPDMQVSVDGVVADESHAVVRWSVTASHTGDHLGFPASHQRVSFRGMTWLSFRDGKIVGGWDAWNQGALIQSLQAQAGSAPARAEARH